MAGERKVHSLVYTVMQQAREYSNNMSSPRFTSIASVASSN